MIVDGTLILKLLYKKGAKGYGFFVDLSCWEATPLLFWTSTNFSVVLSLSIALQFGVVQSARKTNRKSSKYVLEKP